MVATILILVLVLGGCSYGTYNERGSYPHQDNSTSGGCKK